MQERPGAGMSLFPALLFVSREILTDHLRKDSVRNFHKTTGRLKL